jgi:hypothetical protein
MFKVGCKKYGHYHKNIPSTIIMSPFQGYTLYWGLSFVYNNFNPSGFLMIM